MTKNERVDIEAEILAGVREVEATRLMAELLSGVQRRQLHIVYSCGVVPGHEHACRTAASPRSKPSTSSSAIRATSSDFPPRHSRQRTARSTARP